ncbi:MAG: hypothetical protein KTR30_32170 [Saprospiraceae bacterium]|nr:hypothetical protein [Saprospiraceae bacterium]
MKNLYVALLLLLGALGSSCSNKPMEAHMDEDSQRSVQATPHEGTEATFERFKAHNGVTFSFLKLLPEHYQADKSYPAMLVFPAMEPAQEKADWVVEKLFTGSHNENWIVIVVDAPQKQKHGWINHPAHHALNDLMDHIKESHQIEKGRFHFLGYETGSRPAFTFAGMSRDYVQSLSFVGVKDWGELDERGFERAEGLAMPIVIYANGKEAALLEQTKAIEQELKHRKTTIHLLVQQDDTAALESLQAGGILEKASNLLLAHH